MKIEWKRIPASKVHACTDAARRSCSADSTRQAPLALVLGGAASCLMLMRSCAAHSSALQVSWLSGWAARAAAVWAKYLWRCHSNAKMMSAATANSRSSAT